MKSPPPLVIAQPRDRPFDHPCTANLMNSVNLFQEQQGGNTSCHKCGKEALGTGEILRALGVVFHPACFVCSVCNKDLTAKDTPFQADDAKNLFCRDCYNK